MRRWRWRYRDVDGGCGLPPGRHGQRLHSLQRLAAHQLQQCRTRMGAPFLAGAGLAFVLGHIERRQLAHAALRVHLVHQKVRVAGTPPTGQSRRFCHGINACRHRATNFTLRIAPLYRDLMTPKKPGVLVK